MNYVISFIISNNNLEEMITYFKDKNYKSKKGKIKKLTTLLKSFDKFVIIATTSSSITLSRTGTGLTIILTSTGIACGLTIGKKVLYEIVMQKYNNFKNQYEKDQQTIKSFDILNRKTLHDNLTDENEFKCLCIIFTKYLDETKNESFLQKDIYNHNFLVLKI